MSDDYIDRKVWVRCSTCNGSGVQKGKTCPGCNGARGKHETRRIFKPKRKK